MYARYEEGNIYVLGEPMAPYDAYEWLPHVASMMTPGEDNSRTLKWIRDMESALFDYESDKLQEQRVSSW